MSVAEPFTIFEFARISGLSLEQIALLLAHGELPFSKASDGSLLIEGIALEPVTLALATLRASGSELPPFRQPLTQTTVELVGSVLASELDSIVEEAVALALQWVEADSDDAEPDAA